MYSSLAHFQVMMLFKLNLGHNEIRLLLFRDSIAILLLVVVLFFSFHSFLSRTSFCTYLTLGQLQDVTGSQAIRIFHISQEQIHVVAFALAAFTTPPANTPIPSAHIPKSVSDRHGNSQPEERCKMCTMFLTQCYSHKSIVHRSMERERD